MELDCKESELYLQEEGTFAINSGFIPRIEDIVMTPKKGVIKYED